MKNLKSMKKHIFLTAFLILLLSITTICIAAMPDKPNSINDTDHNWITDSWEIGYFGIIGIDPNNDPDGDALTNLEEYLIDTNPNSLTGSNPTVFDSNNDGDADGFDNLREKQDPMMTDPTRADSYPGDGNLVINPSVFWPDIATIRNWPTQPENWQPAGWTKYNDNQEAGLKASWAGEDPDHPEAGPRRLKSECSEQATEFPQWNLGWYQDVSVRSQEEARLPEDAVYELVSRYRVKDRSPLLNWDGTLGGTSENLSEKGGGVVTTCRNDKGITAGERSSYPYCVTYDTVFSDWSDEDGCYHNLGKYSDPDWRTDRVYIRPNPITKSIRTRAILFSAGTIYFDYVSIKKVDRDGNIPLFKKSGSIKFVKNKSGTPVFIIGLQGTTPVTESNTNISYDALKSFGFNAARVETARGAEHAASGLYGIGSIASEPYGRNEPGSPRGFKLGVASFAGLERTIGKVHDLAEQGGPEVLILNGVDESNFRVSTDGAPMDLRELNFQKQKVREVLANIPLMLNVGWADCTIANDIPHAKLMDVVSVTWNCPISYTNAREAASMARAGETTRKWLDITACVNDGESKPVIAFGLGVYSWSQWDYSDGYNHKNQIIPFHLQRYQLYNQVVNGAGGVYFFNGSHMNFMTDPSFRDNWNQIKELSGEFGSLYDVYVEPGFYDEWTSDKRVEAMLKKHDGRIYLIATNPSEYCIGDVNLTLTNVESIKKVRALYENADTIQEYPMPYPEDGVDNGDAAAYPNDEANRSEIRKRGKTDLNFTGRDIPIGPDGISFTDKFIDYAVHVYEIEYVPHVGDEVISIELNDAAWILDGIEPGEVRDNIAYFGADRPRHAVKNTGNVNVTIDIGYGPSAGQVQPGIKQDIDRFITCVGRMTNSVIIPPTGKAEVGVGVKPGDTLPLWLTYGAPTALSQQISGMSAAYEIRAYKSSDAI